MPMVIVVEDDAAVRAALTFAFELDGFHVRTHDSGGSAAASEMPSRGCLVVEYDLPDMNGLQLLERLRERAVNLPAVMIATQPSRSVLQQAAEAGAPIVEKPLLSDALLESVRRALEADR